MLLQTNSYIVPKDKRVEHARLLRRFRQALARLGCDHFEAFEQVGSNWAGETTGRFVQIMRFRDRKHQQEVQIAERADPAAQDLIREFCELINFPYQQQQGYFAVGFYNSALPIAPLRHHGALSSAEHEAPEVGSDSLPHTAVSVTGGASIMGDLAGNDWQQPSGTPTAAPDEGAVEESAATASPTSDEATADLDDSPADAPADSTEAPGAEQPEDSAEPVDAEAGEPDQQVQPEVSSEENFIEAEGEASAESDEATLNDDAGFDLLEGESDSDAGDTDEAENERGRAWR